MTGKSKIEGRIERTARLRWVPLTQMRVNPLAQRDLNQTRVSQLAASFDVEQMGNPTVSHRGGWYYLVDGQRAPRKRFAVFPVQPGGTRREVPGPDGFTWIRKVKGTRACQESSSRAQAYGAVCCGARAIWLKLDCLNPNLQLLQVELPPERRLIPAPCPAPASADGWCNLRDMGRCPVRALKEMSGEPNPDHSR
jgi:hypothetical protein